MNPVLLDVMLNGHYVCQLRYTKRGFPTTVDGKTVECYDYNDFERFVLEQRPSLKGKPFVVLPSNQKVKL